MPTELDLSPLTRSPISRALGPEGLAALARDGRVRRFGAGERLWRQGEVAATIYVVLAGRVRLDRRHPLLKEPVDLAELGPGEVAGEERALAGAPSATEATALVETEVVELSAVAVARLAAQAPDAELALRAHLRVPLAGASEAGSAAGPVVEQKHSPPSA